MRMQAGSVKLALRCVVYQKITDELATTHRELGFPKVTRLVDTFQARLLKGITLIGMENDGPIRYSCWSDERPRRDKSGNRWNFCYWYAGALSDPKSRAARLFFWDDQKSSCGVVLFPPDATKPYSRIKSLIEKLVADANLRRRHQRELQFPLEAHYSGYPAFSEEVRDETSSRLSRNGRSDLKDAS
jgi:hypothetical protein